MFPCICQNDIHDVDEMIFHRLSESDCNTETYENNYNKSMDLTMKKVALKYHTNQDFLVISPELNATDNKLRS